MELTVPLKAAAVALALGTALACAWAAPPAQGAAKTLVVEAGKQARALVPMSIDLAEKVAQARMTSDGKDVPCQVVEGKLCWILDALAAGATKTYTVDLGAAGGAGAGGVALKATADRVEIAIDGKPFTAYHFTNPKVGAHQLRRPYFWPVLGPGQVPMTRPYPMTTESLAPNVSTDHPHHTSLWVAHGEVNGADNWSVGGKAGWQVHRAFEATGSGPVVGWFRETLDWTDAEEKPNLAEVRTVRVWRMPDTSRLLDLELAFHAKYGRVTFGDTKEGGLCATRMRDELRADGKGGAKGRLVNSEGQTDGDAWGKKALWVDCSGTIDGKRLGFALFDAPGNLRHPTPWHARTYGLVTANPFGLKNFDKNAPEKGDLALDAGQSLTQRYRIYFHPGDEAEAKVAARYADWADPPRAAWK